MSWCCWGRVGWQVGPTCGPAIGAPLPATVFARLIIDGTDHTLPYLPTTPHHLSAVHESD